MDSLPITGQTLWNRMERAVEKVQERLQRAAVHLIFAGEMVHDDSHKPNPDVDTFGTLPFDTLVLWPKQTSL